MTQKQYYKEPLATFKTNDYLLSLNILIKMGIVLFIGFILYMILALAFKFKLDPVTLFVKYLPYCLGFSLQIAMPWVLLTQRKIVEVYKDKMSIYGGTERKKVLEKEIDYSSIISFDLEKDYLVIIPLPASKTIISSGTGRINKLTKLNCLTKQDFIDLHQLCNERLSDREIPLRKSRTFHT